MERLLIFPRRFIITHWLSMMDVKYSCHACPFVDMKFVENRWIAIQHILNRIIVSPSVLIQLNRIRILRISMGSVTNYPLIMNLIGLDALIDGKMLFIRMRRLSMWKWKNTTSCLLDNSIDLWSLWIKTSKWNGFDWGIIAQCKSR